MGEDLELPAGKLGWEASASRARGKPVRREWARPEMKKRMWTMEF